jgi:hypothetical protein
MKALIPVEMIEKKILLIRGHKVMLDSDLAMLYEVETFNLNKAVKEILIASRKTLCSSLRRKKPAL